MNDQQRFSSNTSTDSSRYASNNRSHSGSQTPILLSQALNNNGINNENINISTNANNSINIGIGSNRNSLKDNGNSNRSSMDVSTCSYSTLIIHPDDTLHIQMNRLAGDHQDETGNKKDRPYSYGEQGMQEITEIPDDYLNQSHVLKHLAKEMSNNRQSNRQRTSSRERSLFENAEKQPPKYEQWLISESEQINNKLKSKSQPDLTKYITYAICE